MGIDISNFYLNTPLERYGYMRMKLDNFPPDMIEQYNLNALVDTKGFVYCEVRKGMYGTMEGVEEQLARGDKIIFYMRPHEVPGGFYIDKMNVENNK